MCEGRCGGSRCVRVGVCAQWACVGRCRVKQIVGMGCTCSVDGEWRSTAGKLSRQEEIGLGARSEKCK